MSVLIRIALYMLAGYLSGSGYINDELKAAITDDPAVASAVQFAISGIVAAVPLYWWRLAKRLGWST